jgi:hypothetical protein
MGMKLYIWEDVLVDWSSGVIFALAENEEEAREVVALSEYNSKSMLCTRDVYLEKYRTWRKGNRVYGIYPSNALPTSWEETVKSPVVYDKPIGYMQWGGA